MTRSEILARIDKAYGYRVKGDLEGIRSMFAPNAMFRIGGSRLPLPGELYEEPSAIKAIATLMDEYRFHAVERVDSVVEGNKAAVLSRASISSGTGPAHSVELFDLFTIGPDGLFTSFVQFVDAGFIAMLAGR